MKALNILIVHGIGWGDEGKHYARALQKMIAHEFEKAVRRLRLDDIMRGDINAKRGLRFEAAYWSPVTQESQNSLLKLLKLNGFSLSNWVNLTYQARKQMVSLLGDVIAYEAGGAVYREIHARVDECVCDLNERSGDDLDANGYAQLTVVGHSLGSVIASDYVWDHTRGAACPHYLTDTHLSIKNVVLFGSPMALYALRNNPNASQEKLAESLDSPIQVDPDNGLWLNMYNRHDPIAFPLHPIESYARVGVIDCAVPAGTLLTKWNPASHTAYWNSADCASIIGQKLALDWAALNSAGFLGDVYQKAVKTLCQTLHA